MTTIQPPAPAPAPAPSEPPVLPAMPRPDETDKRGNTPPLRTR